jgi:subtilisin family serine protease
MMGAGRAVAVVCSGVEDEAMRVVRGVLSAAIVLALGCSSSAMARSGAAPDREGMYLVHFAGEPLVNFRGDPAVRNARGKALAPTAPAAQGKTRVDLDSTAARAYLSYLGAQRDAFARTFSRNAKTAPAIRFDYRILANAVAVRLTPEQAQALRALPEVVAVEPDYELRLQTDAGPAWVGAPALWNGIVPGSGVRTRGEGVVVGVLDTGINSAHPSFADVGGDGYNHVNPRGGFLGVCASNPGRCNDKLIGIWDMTDEGARDGSDIDGHGSHVASTAVGNVYSAQVAVGTQSFAANVSGVAPHANLITYKVCRIPANDPNGEATCPVSAMVAALEQAVRDNVDVVNASIGGDAADPWAGVRSPATDDHEAWLNARAAGIVTVLSAGNAGPGASTVLSASNAPWVIAVANQTHDRLFGTTLSNLNGTGITTPQSFVGGGATGALPERRVVHAKDFGNALCGVGASQGINPTGASNPFPAGTFHGEIVICTRGIYARVEKSFNVAQSGAGGMILANTEADGASVVSDAHVIPTVHLGYANARIVEQRVEAARVAGGAVNAAILATQRAVSANLADVLNASSSRGPVTPYGDWLKPNISAPGTSILAAARTGAGLAFLSGTSMASPHVAGGAALLAAANPTWSVAQIESALLTTGASGVRKQDGVTLADAHDVGTGRMSLPDAVRANLYFGITRQDFATADPALNGLPRNMNMPYLVDDACNEICLFSRRFTNGGQSNSWTVIARMPSGVEVTFLPLGFSLAQGESRDFGFTVRVLDPNVLGRWVYGEIALIPSSLGVEQRIPVAVFASPGDLPDRFDLRANATSGYADVDVSGLAALPDATFTTTAPALAQVVADPVTEDPTPSSVYDNPLSGGMVRVLNFAGASGGARTFSLIAETASVSSRDIDLFVGLDSNGNGLPEAAEAVCVSDGASTGERCIVDFSLNGSADTRSYWIFAQNLDGTVPGGDVITLTYTGLDTTPVAQDGSVEGSLTATGPGMVARGAGFPLRLAWNMPRMLPGERYMGYVGFGATRNAPGQLGRTLVNITADTTFAYAPRVLRAGNGLAYNFRLNPGTAHERVVIDVPPNATTLTVSSQANAGDPNVDLYLAKAPGGVVAPDMPSAPPRGQAQGTSIHPGAVESITLTGAQLTPGRWYVTPVNAGTSIADFRIAVATTLSGDAPSTRDAGYYNPARSGHGIFLNEAGSAWLVFWYTYLQDGTPVWYQAQADKPASTDSVWRSPLYRVVWNGTQTQGTAVGEVIITRTGTDQLVYSWLLDGQWGSENMVRLEGTGCATLNGMPADFSGAWYAPTQSGYGTSVLSFANTEVEIAYIYDGLGVPRWAYGSVAPFGASNFVMGQFRGFCPLCAYAPVQGTAAGTLSRTFDTVTTGTLNINMPFLAPVPGTWTSARASARLSRTLSCTP